MSVSVTDPTPLPPTAPVRLDDAVPVFKALADPARLKILAHLQRRDPGCCAPGESVCACDLEEVTALSQPTVSHHMKILTRAGLVIGEKEGRWMYYRIDPDGFDLARRILAQLGE